ncbi:TIGR01244 family phosphatase [Roseobacter sp. YSTF-M11]|uniref:TIGR01244 family phosphatase n=1 Tax=Roseobacter insulae TaxID=2859783 RepID=A0A9X1FYQ7_9RHOB|nr:TIGR01244 family sulfur transferase [Roseobacter insulae]MBW4710184.1 TIGR01244 family phosphatase [Roseobacter insulae]
MDIRQITPDFYAAPQICAEDMADIAAIGIKLVLCNRPDAEVPPSHQCAAIEEAAAAAGLDFAYRPLTHQSMTPEVIAANRGVMDDANGPVLAYCASGTRSTIAWALAAARDRPAEEIIQAARAGGYDLENLRGTLTAIAGQAR